MISNNQNGFSLIQVIIAFGLTTVLTLQLFKMSSYQVKITKNSEVSLDVSLMMNQIALYMSNNISCKETLNGINLSSINDFQNGDGIKNQNGEIVYEVGNYYAGDRILLKSISIGPSEHDKISIPNDLYGLMKLNISLVKQPKQTNTLSVKDVTKSLFLQIRVNENSQIISCNSLNDTTALSLRAATCEHDLKGTWNSNLGECENIQLKGNSSGNLCGTCQHTIVSQSPTNHRDLHQSAIDRFTSKNMGKWFHGWSVFNSNKPAPTVNNQGLTVGETCRTILSCNNGSICNSSENNSSCFETCPEGYSMKVIYEDFDIIDKSYTESVKTQVLLKSCIKN